MQNPLPSRVPMGRSKTPSVPERAKKEAEKALIGRVRQAELRAEDWVLVERLLRLLLELVRVIEAKNVTISRLKAAAYLGAEWVECRHAELAVGSQCPGSGCHGQLHRLSEGGRFIRLTGQPLVGATRYDQEVLSCSCKCLLKVYGRLVKTA